MERTRRADVEIIFYRLMERKKTCTKSQVFISEGFDDYLSVTKSPPDISTVLVHATFILYIARDYSCRRPFKITDVMVIFNSDII